ncbi:MAG: hypothetical protein KDA89_18590, partial [Planctomycetaceae bacterium]|nr:hypothetical protein [Planctomycetaceae bacterium]
MLQSRVEHPDSQVVTQRSDIRIVCVILPAGMVVRVPFLVWFADRDVPIADAQDYQRLATGIVEQGAYV